MPSPEHGGSILLRNIGMQLKDYPGENYLTCIIWSEDMKGRNHFGELSAGQDNIRKGLI
jgi:hypothetical protein